MVVPLMPADPAATVAAAGLSRTARRPERSKVRRPTACQAIARGFFEPTHEAGTMASWLADGSSINRLH